jgi:hypothetical protein
MHIIVCDFRTGTTDAETIAARARTVAHEFAKYPHETLAASSEGEGHSLPTDILTLCAMVEDGKDMEETRYWVVGFTGKVVLREGWRHLG